MGKKIMNKKKCIVIMGVAGAGKSTLGNLFTKKKDCVFIEGDDLHSKENKQKMKNGIPLNDEDRFSWLQLIKSEISLAELSCILVKEVFIAFINDLHTKRLLSTKLLVA